MKRVSSYMAILAMTLAGFTPAIAYESMVGPTGALKYNDEKSYGGYTLFSPMVNCKTTYLIDMEGNVFHNSRMGLRIPASCRIAKKIGPWP